MTQKYTKFLRTLKEYTKDTVITDNKDPILLNLNGEEISVYLSNLTQLHNYNNKVRIAPKRNEIDIQKHRHKNGVTVAFLGTFDGGKNYCSWNLPHVFSLKTKTSSSLYAPKMYEKKKLSFPDIYKGDKHYVVIIPSSALGTYLENIRKFHSTINGSQAIQNLKRRTSASLDILATSHSIDPEKERLVYLWKKFRDPEFRRKVMRAYGNSCCVCKFQPVVDAAHIIPHKHEKSCDSVTNGLLLCPNHHRMYDDSLFSISSDYKILINHDLVDKLRDKGRHGGIDDLVRIEGCEISLPARKEDRPSKEFLEYGDKIRAKT